MRILIDLKSHPNDPKIVQVERTPTTGTDGAVPINGKYAIPVVKGAEFPIDSSSYVLDGLGDCDGGDVSSISYAYLLAQYPMFGNVYFNPLLTSTHVEELDFTATFRDTFSDPPNIHIYSPRLQTGRSILNPLPGQMPTHTALLPINPTLDPVHPTSLPNHPGLLITKEIDIGAYTLDPFSGDPVGADEFVMYWKLYEFDISNDVAHNLTNDPAIRTIKECDQEPSGFSAYLSPDNGTTWCQAGLLESIAFCSKTTKIRVAFLNTSASKRYIATYAVLF